MANTEPNQRPIPGTLISAAAPGADSNDVTRVDRLTAGADGSIESHVLDHILGEWEVAGTWEPIPGRPTWPISGRVVNLWTLGGRVLESTTYENEGHISARLLLGFDPTDSTYFAFSTTVLSNSFDLERGTYDKANKQLMFIGSERALRSPLVVVYSRTFRFIADDRYEISIGYPDVPPGTYGEMHLSFTRIDRSWAR